MKILFKITLATFLAVFFVQSSFAQVAFGVKAGANLANIKSSTDDDGETKSIVSFNGGLIIEAPISETFGIRTGFEFQGKGAKSSFSDSTFSLKASINAIYGQIPVVFAYNGSSFFIGAGPFLGVGIAGKTKIKSTGLGSGFDFDETEKIKFGSKEDDNLSLIDFGVRVEAGLKLDKIRISLNYDLGLANALPKDARGEESLKNGVLGVSFGYMF
jgi:Outer membrane protein beta-barrel domain